ncbi:HNH endonuclease [Streptomyces sp. SID8499]|uniref:HNH endonuclease n=1 Tax=Streptomyces sp. SID8499 TaxID=2706106 RepID=UPI0019446F8D
MYCDAPGGTVDHVIPLSRGGQHAEGNLVPACKSCNSSKGDKLLIEWLLVKRANAMR